jgi:hypothetical protein
VDTVGGDLGWSLGVVRVSRSFSTLPVTQARIKGILILFITYIWFSLNHIQDPFGILDENFRIYTLVTPIKFQQVVSEQLVVVCDLIVANLSSLYDCSYS